MKHLSAGRANVRKWLTEQLSREANRADEKLFGGGMIGRVDRTTYMGINAGNG
jgi:hypothetical protein